MTNNIELSSATAAAASEDHERKMAKKKAIRDKIIATKTRNQGLLLVFTGKGKGKSTAAFGMIFRAIAHGIPSAVIQFIKGGMETGERNLIKKHFSHLCQFYTMGDGFTWETQNLERDISRAQAAWKKAQLLICDPNINMVVLDELSVAIHYNYIRLEEVLDFLKIKRPHNTHVIIKGRNAHKDLIALADLATDMRLHKHPFSSGISAQAGVEF